jgi:hypothetical protein
MLPGSPSIRTREDIPPLFEQKNPPLFFFATPHLQKRDSNWEESLWLMLDPFLAVQEMR